MQDRAIDLFRAFASSRNVHITLVIHPRKESEHSGLSVSSVFGSAKATQEADNVIILQTPEQFDLKEMLLSKYKTDSNESMMHPACKLFRHLEVKKNRFDGDLGIVPFVYDRNTCRIFEPTMDMLNQKLSQGQNVIKSIASGQEHAKSSTPSRKSRKVPLSREEAQDLESEIISS